ncbi:MAG: alpha-amylase family glycosyl hydrolase [Acidobacteriota bacterium]|nr:alpha-amylase family glycosyl hydrolase [Acidobacteriota bacterium]
MHSSLPTPRRLLLVFALAIPSLAAPTSPAQTLARPGWAGSGISTDLWWKHAILYQLNPANFTPTTPAETPLHALILRLDYLRTLGADAILLTPIQTDPAHATTIQPPLGTLDDFDDLLREGSRRNLRILLDLAPEIPSADLPNIARFWLNRGVAGFHITGSSPASHAQAAALRGITDTFLGQRILIADADPSLPAAPTRTYKSPDGPTPHLRLDTSLANQQTLTASAIRPILENTQDIADAGRSLPLLATDSPGLPRSFTRYADHQHDLDIAKVLATILLTTRAGSVLYDGQELGVPTPEPTPLIVWEAPPPTHQDKPTAQPIPADTPDTASPPNAALEQADPNSLFNWYRQLIALHHSNATLASGSTVTLNQDDKNVLVWIRKPRTITPLSPPVVILCNLTAQPASVSLKADIARLHLRGSFLRTLLRSDNGMGSLHLDSITLPPYTAYIGQLRY